MTLRTNAINHIRDNWQQDLNLNEAQVQELASRIVENFEYTEYWDQMDNIINVYKP
jgi:hypothetical protein